MRLAGLACRCDMKEIDSWRDTGGVRVIEFECKTKKNPCGRRERERQSGQGRRLW